MIINTSYASSRPLRTYTETSSLLQLLGEYLRITKGSPSSPPSAGELHITNHLPRSFFPDPSRPTADAAPRGRVLTPPCEGPSPEHPAQCPAWPCFTLRERWLITCRTGRITLSLTLSCCWAPNQDSPHPESLTKMMIQQKGRARGVRDFGLLGLLTFAMGLEQYLLWQT